MSDAELKQVIQKVEDIVDARVKKAENTTLVNKSGKTDWLHVSLLVGFTLTNIIALFVHGKLGVALEKIDHLERIITAASHLAM